MLSNRACWRVQLLLYLVDPPKLKLDAHRLSWSWRGSSQALTCHITNLQRQPRLDNCDRRLPIASRYICSRCYIQHRLQHMPTQGLPAT